MWWWFASYNEPVSTETNLFYFVSVLKVEKCLRKPQSKPLLALLPSPAPLRGSRLHNWGLHYLLFPPLSIAFPSFFLPSPSPEVGSPKYSYRWSWDCCMLPSGNSNLVHFSFKIWHLVATILVLLIFLRINNHSVCRPGQEVAKLVGYRGGSPTAVQAWQPCPLWELSPSHPILL